MASKRGPPNKAAGTARGPPPKAAVTKAAAPKDNKNVNINNNNSIDSHPLQLKLSQQNGMHIELGGPNPLHIQLAGPNDGGLFGKSPSALEKPAAAARASARPPSDFQPPPGASPNWYQQLQVAASQADPKRGGGGAAAAVSDNMDTQLTLNANGTLTVARHGLSHPGQVFHISQSGGQHHITLDSTSPPAATNTTAAAPHLPAPPHQPLQHQHTTILPSTSQAGLAANFPFGFPFPPSNQYTQFQQGPPPPPLPFHPGMFLPSDNLIIPPMKKVVDPRRRATTDNSKSSTEKSFRGAKDVNGVNNTNKPTSAGRDATPLLPEFEPYSYRDWLALKQRDGSMRLPSSLGANETEAWKQKLEKLRKMQEYGNKVGRRNSKTGSLQSLDSNKAISG